MARSVCAPTALLLGILLVVTAVGCSSSTADQGQANVGGSPDETTGCGAIAASREFPIIGAFLGPDPGPCTLRSSATEYVFEYEADGTLSKQVSTDGLDQTAFSYQQRLLVGEKRTWSSGASETTYEYAGDQVRVITIDLDSKANGYEYTFDERGYVRKARLLNTPSALSVPTRYTYEYTNCAVQWRVAYDSNDAVNLTETVKYTYDTAGRLVTRTSVTSEEQFDYSCW